MRLEVRGLKYHGAFKKLCLQGSGATITLSSRGEIKIETAAAFLFLAALFAFRAIFLRRRYGLRV